MSLRRRLFLAFAVVSLPALAGLAGAVLFLVSRSADRTAGERLHAALRGVDRRVRQMHERASAHARGVARDEVGRLDEDPDPFSATSWAQRRELSVLELVDSAGRVVTSHHFRASLGLPDRDRAFPGSVLRAESVGEGHGTPEKLAVVAETRATWAGRPATVRAGYLLDDDALAELSELVGAEAGIRDLESGRWIAAAASPLRQWTGPLGRGEGEEVLSGRAYRWAAAELAPRVVAVVAVPETVLSEVAGGVVGATVVAAAVALSGALFAALVLSGRIAEPVVGELRESRERLLQAERVAAWREMARRLAHELKNPIFPIQLSIETMRRLADRGDTRDTEFRAAFHDSSATILDELAALRKIIDEFSQFARMPSPRPAPLDVNEVAAHTLRLYEARAGQVRVQAQLGQGLPLARADRDLLARALGNLVANAIEAMPEGGTVTVRTAADAGGVRIEVEDTGPGLSDDQRTRLFTPYFTTKRGGTGLGLAIVQGIVSDHGGHVDVRSGPGKGTTFAIRLPAVQG